MKKTQNNLPAASLLIFFLFGLTACEKYNCECTAYNTNIPESLGHTNYNVKGTAAKRKKMCDDHTTTADANGNYTQCVIK